jgi:hypothetical protein
MTRTYALSVSHSFNHFSCYLFFMLINSPMSKTSASVHKTIYKNTSLFMCVCIFPTYLDILHPHLAFKIFPTRKSTMIATQGTVPQLRQLVTSFSLWRPKFSPRPVHLGFMVDKIALGQHCCIVLQFSQVCIIPPKFILIHSLITSVL